MIEGRERIQRLCAPDATPVESGEQVYREFDHARHVIDENVLLVLADGMPPVRAGDLVALTKSVATLRAALVRARERILFWSTFVPDRDVRDKHLAADLKAIDEEIEGTK
jgi:hypothetical protein